MYYEKHTNPFGGTSVIIPQNFIRLRPAAVAVKAFQILKMGQFIIVSP